MTKKRKNLNEIRAAAEAIVQQGRERHAAAQCKPGMPPPPPFNVPALTPEYSFALHMSTDNKDQFCAVLQLLLKDEGILFPSGVFPRRYYQAETFSLHPERRKYPHGKPGRPDKQTEGRRTATIWNSLGRPSFGVLARHLHKNLSGAKYKKLADKYRQQVLSVRIHDEDCEKTI